jgi:chaperonin cofactor prefoldin
MRGETPVARDLERRIDSFSDRARDLARQARPTEEQLEECGAALDDALKQIRRILGPE